ncbi:hypothetical protein V6N13_051474 [Hibiscus sabdariffa]
MRRMASSIMARGVDPKLGRSIAHKFSHERYTIAILARDLGRLSRFADEIARKRKRFVEVLVYNAYYQPVSWNPTSFIDIKTDSLEKSLAISFLDAFLCTQQVPVQLSF